MTDTINRQDIPRLDQKFELFHTPDGTVIGRKGSDLYETPITAQHFRTIIDAIDGKRDIEPVLLKEPVQHGFCPNVRRGAKPLAAQDEPCAAVRDGQRVAVLPVEQWL